MEQQPLQPTGGEWQQPPTYETAMTDPAAEDDPQTHLQLYAVHVSSYADGVDHGVWIDASNEPTELDDAISAMLDASPSPHDRAWAVGSTRGFAGISLDGVHDTSLIHTLALGVAEHGTAYAAWVDMIGTNDPDQLAGFEDFYVGSYDNPEAWARSVAEDLDWPEQLDREITDPFLRRYVVIDYAKVARDGAAGWDVVTGIDGRTHVFLR
jgi:antirestriction protein